MTPRGLLFDLDGTLVDSVADLADALNAALDGIAPGALSTPAVQSMVGDGARVLVGRGLAERGGDPGRLDEALRRFMAIYTSAPARRTTVYPGVESTLRRLREAGGRMAVCTNKPQGPARDLLFALGLAPCFSVLVGGGLPGVPLKPSPEPARLCLEELGLRAEDAVLIGDSEADLATGRAAGLPVVLVSYGYARRPVDQLGADAVISTMDALPAALEALP